MTEGERDGLEYHSGIYDARSWTQELILEASRTFTTAPHLRPLLTFFRVIVTLKILLTNERE